MMDSYDLWEENERAHSRWLKKRPICRGCCNHIQDDELFFVEGKFWCLECAEEEFKHYTEDYIE